MKHKFFFLISLLLCITSFVQSQNITVNNINYTLNATDNTASIISNTLVVPVTLTIPDTIRYKTVIYKVTSIANNAFKDCYNISGKLTILASLKSIGNYAFSGCTSMKDTLKLPSTLTSLGTNAFAGCNALQVLTLPSGITTVPASSFQGCSKVSKIIIPTNITSIGDYAFESCTGLTDSVAIPASVTNIGVSAFRNCNIGVQVEPTNPNYTSRKGTLYNKTMSTLIQIPISYAGIDTIPASVTSIGTYAFYKCTGLTGIVLPSSLTTIGTYAFSGCSKLATALNIPVSVTSVGKFAFQGCSKLSTVISPTLRIFAGSFDAAAVNFTLTGTIDARDFKFLRDSTSVSSINLGSATIAAYTGTGGTNNCAYGLSTIPAAVSATFAANTIPAFAFSYANTKTDGTSTAYPIITVTGKSSLKSIVFPTSVTAIGNFAFASNTGLTGIFNIPSSIVSLGNGAFIDCANVTSFGLPSGLTTIGDNAFERCIGLAEPLVLPASLTSIGSYAYSACTNITGVIDLPEGLTTLGTYAFQSCRKISSVTFPTTLKTIPAGVCSNCDILSNINLREGATTIGANAFEYCTKLTSAAVPTTVTSLGIYAFYECSGITDVTLPNALSKIDNYTFYYCTSLKNVNIPTSLTTIGDYTFYNCTGISAMVLPAAFKTLGQYSFANCTNLKTFIVPAAVTAIPAYCFLGCSGLTDITMPSGITSIGTFAFQNCLSLVNSELPNTLKTIGDVAFGNCGSLKSVTLPASLTAVGNYTFTNCSAPLFVDAANTTYSSQDSVLFNKAMTTLIQCPISKKGSYIIPGTVTSLGAYSFYFSKLSTISIPSSVTTIGSAAFYNCTALQTIITSNPSPVNLMSSEDVFYNINSTCTLYVPIGSKSTYEGAAQWNGISRIVESATGVENPVENKISASVSNGQLHIDNLSPNKAVDIYSFEGKCITHVIANAESVSITLPAPGVYIIKIDNQSLKIAYK